MQILLPPSEGKLAPERTKRLDLSQLSFAELLAKTRESLLNQHPEVEQRLTAPAHEVYTGFLYKALSYKTLHQAARSRADNEVIIISALFGALRLNDEISAYKLKMVSSLWKQPLKEALNLFVNDLIVDCRSSTYQSAWRPNAANTVEIKVFTKVGDQKKVITHMAKVTRGEVARVLLAANKTPASPEEVHAILSGHFNCDLIKRNHNKPWSIEITSEY